MNDQIQPLLDHMDFERFYREKVKIKSQSNDELKGICPFHEDKVASFCANVTTGLFHCFGCTAEGSVFQFIEKFDKVTFPKAVKILANFSGVKCSSKKHGKKDPTPKEDLPPINPELPGKYLESLLHLPKKLDYMKKQRGLSEETIKRSKIGWNGNRFSIPIYDEEGKLVNIRLYNPSAKSSGQKMISYWFKDKDGEKKTGYGKARLYGVDEIRNRPGEAIVVCAGEWDKLIGSEHKYLCVTGTGGEGTWKPAWNKFFKDRIVRVIYDLDEQGRKGAKLVIENLLPVVKEIKDVYLPLRGYQFDENDKDLTDFFVKGKWKFNESKELLDSVILNTPDLKARERLAERLASQKQKSTSTPAVPLQPSTLKEVLDTFGKWLKLEETYYIEIIMATLVSNQMPGDPVWLFVIAPPGASKTEVLRTFNKLGSKVYITSKLTSHSLISGKKFKSGYDPSLLPKLNNKTLIIKDFTAILGIQREERQTIFSDLRESFDGYLGKDFGNIGHKGFSSHFSLIAAVTPVIDKYVSVEQELGERFLKVRLREGNSREKITKAIENVDCQEEMREELASIMQRFLSQKFDVGGISMPQKIKEGIVKLANFIAICRTHVSRDPYRRNTLTYLPEPEVGTRIGIQLSKIGKGLAAIRKRKEIGEDELRLLVRIGVDTIPKKRMIILGSLSHEYCSTTSEIVKNTGMEGETCRLALNDLQVLKLVTSEKVKAQGNPRAWKLSKEAQELSEFQ